MIPSVQKGSVFDAVKAGFVAVNYLVLTLCFATISAWPVFAAHACILGSIDVVFEGAYHTRTAEHCRGAYSAEVGRCTARPPIHTAKKI